MDPERKKSQVVGKTVGASVSTSPSSELSAPKDAEAWEEESISSLELFLITLC